VTADPGIVTPEGVVLEFSTADVGSRLLAKLIDLVIQAALLAALLTVSSVAGRAIKPIGLAGVYLSLFVAVIVYPAMFETLWRGRTPGKAALGLRVITADGSPIRCRHAAIRAILGLIDFYLLTGAIATLTILLTPKHQRLGDLLAGTIVLRERSAAGRATPVTFMVPPGYESYAATLDVSGLSAADYEAVRSFLLRAASLQDAARYELGRQIATSLLGRLRHTPPPWVSPELLLVCIAAVYQQRQRPPGWSPAIATAGPLATPVASIPPPPDQEGFVAPL
jgi:uncharacterized RDD family membrane protein YckC